MKGIQYLHIKDIDMEANGEVEIADGLSSQDVTCDQLRETETTQINTNT